MLQGLKDYARCAYYNRATLTGYFVLGTSLAYANPKDIYDLALTEPAFFSFFSSILSVGVSLLGATGFWAGTFSAHKRARRHLNKFGGMSEEVKMRLSSDYCSRVGLNLALKEANLEERL